MRGIYETRNSIDPEDGPRLSFDRVAETSEHYRQHRLNSTQDTAAFAKAMLKEYFDNRRDAEEMLVIALDTKNRPLRIVRATRGTLDASLVHPREIFRPAIAVCAASIILVHNHPSGEAIPSRQDYEVTDTMQQAGKLLGIHVLDHLIVGDDVVSIMSMRGR